MLWLQLETREKEKKEKSETQREKIDAFTSARNKVERNESRNQHRKIFPTEKYKLGKKILFCCNFSLTLMANWLDLERASFSKYPHNVIAPWSKPALQIPVEWDVLITLSSGYFGLLFYSINYIQVLVCIHKTFGFFYLMIWIYSAPVKKNMNETFIN